MQEAEVKQKAELYSVASHGLRSPLMSIITWIDWILETGVQNDMHRARLQDIRSQTFNLSRFVGEILDMSRIEVGNVRIRLMPMAIVPFVKKAVAVFELRAPTHRFEVEITDAIPPARGDETQLSIVLDHLMENAVKYSPVGSLVRVKIGVKSDQVYVSISDQGPGILPDEIENLFSRFYRGRQQSSSGHSLGLGLYISKNLVEAQGGDVWVDSEVDKGSTFTFTLHREKIGD
jgi:signal transduction histidine kinase